MFGHKRRKKVSRWNRRATVSHGRPLRFEPLEDRRLLAVITVDTLADENDGIAAGDISLRDAIADANPNDTIEFSVEGTIALTHGELLVDQDLSIVGPGAHLLTIDARGASRVFNVDNGNGGTLINVAISGLTITGGVTGADGGGILTRETLTVTACHITGNSAEDGGGIGNFAGTFTVTDTTISDNTATGTNGGGAGIFNFSVNKAATSTISNSTISNNTTTTTGGGIYNFLGTIIVEYSTITENDAPATKGSGIASLGDTNVVATQVRSSIIAGNLHSDVDIVVGFQPTFASLNYNLIGFGTATGTFTTLGDVRNVADPLLGPLTDNGGPTPTHLPLVGSPAIDTGNPAFAPPPNFDQRGDTYVRVFDGDGDTTARIDKGAVERDIVLFQVDTLADENDVDFSAGDFSLREAIGQASLVAAGTPTIVFAPSLTAGGPATILLALGQLEIGERMVVEGPGASLLTIDAQQDSRVFRVDDLVDNNVIEVKISGLTITGAETDESGGGIYSNERFTLADSVVSGNVAQWGGGIYAAEFGSLLVLRSRITGNSADVLDDDTGEGGGFYNWGSTAKFVESTISGNMAPRGAGISNANFGDTTIDSSTISGNIAGFFGGGADTDSGTLTIRNSTISGNRAEQGGGININTAPFLITTISNSTISGNVAPSGGGGIHNYQGHAVIEFCTITENVSNDFAGSGVRSGDSPTAITEIYSSVVAANFDPNGGGQSAPYDVAVSGGINTLGSLGYNIVGIGGFVNETFDEMGDQIIGTGDPLLGPLADNGGPTLTHALLSGSPALDQGDPSAMAGAAGVPKYDQRGISFERIRDGNPPASIVMDVGAFEAQSIPPALAGDYNLNGTVDTADYVVWRNTLGSNVLAYSGADGSGNGIVDETDYGVWRSNFGNFLPPASASGAAADGSEVAPASQPTALQEVGAVTVLPLPVSVTVQPSHRDVRTAGTTPASTARHDVALLAWLASRGDSSRQFGDDGSSDLADGRTEPSTDGTWDAVTIDAALVALCASL